MEIAKNETKLNKLEKKVLNDSRQWELFSGGPVLVGVSGGADSMALVVLLFRLQEILNLDLSVLTLHHGIRGESADRDIEIVQNLCKKLNISCYTRYEKVLELANEWKCSTEEAGRRVRYQLFDEVSSSLGSNCKIAIAHHKQDQCETILHNLFRGSGLTGLRGILPKRGKIVRPLLDVSRKEIEEYLKEYQIEFAIDETNLDSMYTRNKIRNELIPYLKKEINDKADEHVLTLANQLRQADDFFEEYVNDWLSQYGTKFPVRLPIEDFLELKPLLQGYVLRKILKENHCSLKDIGMVHIEQSIEVAKKGVGRKSYLSKEILVRRDYDALVVEKISEEATKSSLPKLPKVTYKVFSYNSSEKIPKTPCMKWFDYDKINDALTIRTRQTGDYMQIYPEGGTKSIKALMIDQKIPKEIRDEILLLVDGNHVVWMIGYRISQAYKVTENTKRILQVEIKGGQL
ncbi:tRNA(Ile)-lysidine synthetase [Lachnospiraceae bacterium TWA4]|nr:tRNA(Ile)-lysidine synthetase [Lachnospiraceae bacterium TWA4]